MDKSTGGKTVTRVQQVTTKRGGRYYSLTRTRFTDDGLAGEDMARLYSVTTILSRGMPKPALTRWLQNEVARKAIDYAEQLVEMKANGDSEAAKQMLTAFAGSKRDIAAEAGTAIHQAIEALGQAQTPAEVSVVMGGLDDEVRPFVHQFLAWCEDVQPTFHAQELTCWNERYAYAGTLDMIATVNGQRCIIDIKSGKGAYPEAALQMAAYAHSEFTMAADDDEPTPTSEWGIEKGYVLHLRPDGWELLPVRIDDEVFRMFQSVVQIGAVWAYGMEKDVIGEPELGGAA